MKPIDLKNSGPPESVKDFILDLFLANQSKCYSTQKSLGDEIENRFQKQFTQSAISKALRDLDKVGHTRNGKIYHVVKRDGFYKLRHADEMAQDRQEDLIERCILQKDVIYYENEIKRPQTFIFWIAQKDGEECAKKAQDEMKKIVPSALDVFIYQDKLVVLLNPKSDDFSNESTRLKNFWKY